MSVTDECDAPPELCEPPEFALCYEVDDPGAPSTVTVFPADADEIEILTTWISADLDHAVPLAEAR